MNITGYCLLVPLMLASLATQDSSDVRGQVLPTVNRIADYVRSTRSLSYPVNYISVEPGATDSIHRSAGDVWLERLPQDTIFGCRLHVRGSDDNGGFDYFYDGQDSYELRHSNRTITLFHPHLYPNSPNNPAKARMSLLLFLPLVVDPSISHELLSDLVDSTLKVAGGVGTLTLTHHPNEFGQVVTQKLQFRADDYSVLSSETDVAWRGTFVKYVVSLGDFRRNTAIPDTIITFTKMPTDYQLIETNRDQPIEPGAGKQLLGTIASDFAYPELAGQETSLRQFRGKLVLLDFWETWCGHCIASFPRMNALQEDYVDQGLVILGITTENPGLVKRVSAANNLRYRNLLADTRILKNYQITQRPVYVLIDQEGRISSISYGDIKSIEAAIRKVSR